MRVLVCGLGLLVVLFLTYLFVGLFQRTRTGGGWNGVRRFDELRGKIDADPARRERVEAIKREVLAEHAAQVEQLAEALQGIQHLATERPREKPNWEVRAALIRKRAADALSALTVKS